MSDHGITKGDMLVPRKTPAGPPDARVAWAEALNQLIIVLEVKGDLVTYNVPGDYRTMPNRNVYELLGDYEKADAVPDQFGRSWAAVIERAASVAAAVEGNPETPGYWREVAMRSHKVLDEERLERERTRAS